MTKRTIPTKRQPAHILCVICGQPVALCTVPGLHGVIRDRAAAASAATR